MQAQGWSVVVVTLLVFVAMARGVRAEISLLVGVTGLTLIGVLTPAQALIGFANEQLHTVALLFIAAAALRRAGSLDLFASAMLGSGRSETLATLRLIAPVAALSSVLNNTPIVAMLIPQVRAWSQRSGIPASRMLIPLSYAAILGGLLTVIGTSTNLVVNGLVTAAGKQPIGFLEIGRVGLPIACVGLLVMVLLGRWLLPSRRSLDQTFTDPQTYTTEVVVDQSGPLVGQQLAKVNVATDGHFAPIEILRDERIIPAPSADHILEAGDRLVFAGPAAHLIALQSHPGLTKTLVPTFDDDNPLRHLAEVLVAPHCPLIGQPVGDGSFRRMYDAAVVAVARHGERVPAQRWSDWILAPGDILLVEASDQFFERSRFSPDFYLVTASEARRPPSRRRALLGLAVLGSMVAAAALGIVSMFTAALAAAGVLAALRYINRQVASEGLDLSVLLTIALSFGLGSALESSGAAASLVQALSRFAGDSPWTALVIIVITTSILTELITNNAAAALMVPLGLAMADRLGTSHLPFVVAVMVAASASFATPIGYTTNLMVYGPGNYRFGDFLRMGVPMNILVCSMACVLIPRIWPF